MQSLPHFSNAHPTWEGDNLNKEEYASLLAALSQKKPDEVFLTDGKSIRVGGLIVQLWQRIKGWLGLESELNPIRVDYELLKLLKYGETHHFFTDDQIQTLFKNLAKTLKCEKNDAHKRIAEVFEQVVASNDLKTSSLIDYKIKHFYVTYKEDLKEAFWPSLFHKYVASSRTYFNEATLCLDQGHHQEAIENLEKALKISPNEADWEFILAKTQLEYAQIKACDEALELSKKALNHLKAIFPIASDLSYVKELSAAKEQAFLSCFALCIKLERHDQAIRYLEEFRKEKEIDGELLPEVQEVYKLCELLVSKMPVFQASHSQQANFILTVMNYVPDLNQKIYWLENAIVELEKANPRPSSLATSSLLATDQRWIEAHTKLVNLYELAGDYKSALKAIEKHYAYHPLPQLTSKISQLTRQLLAKESYQEKLSYYKNRLSSMPSQTAETAKELVSIGNQLLSMDKRMAAEAYKIALPYLDKDLIEKKHLTAIYQLLALDEEGKLSLVNAIDYLQSANKIDPNNLEIIELMAGVYLKQKKFKEALDLFDGYDASSLDELPGAKKIIEDCISHLALQTTNQGLEEAISQYEHSLTFASDDQKQAIALKLLKLGEAIQEDESSKALKLRCYQAAFKANEDLSLFPEKLVVDAYVFMARINVQQKNYELAKDYYQKSLRVLPDQFDLILEYANLDLTSDILEKTAASYHEALRSDSKNATYKKRLLTLELAIADRHYAMGFHTPEHTRQTILNLVNLATNAPFAQKIQSTMGAWKGEKSSAHQELQELAKKAISASEIETDGKRACELLELAYGVNEGASSEMPNELILAINQVRQGIAWMRVNYETLQQRTEAVIATLQTSALSENFKDWTAIAKIQNLEHSHAVEEQAKKALVLIHEEIKKNPGAVSTTIRNEINTLEKLSLPSGLMHLAIVHYRNVFTLDPMTYGEHCNKLIDAYIKVGDLVNAILTFEELKKIFPNNLLEIDDNIYSEVVESSSAHLIPSERLFAGLLRASRQHDLEQDYAEALRIYNQALKIATPTQKFEVAQHLLNLGDKLVNTPAYDQAIKAYASLLPHLSLMELSADKQLNILSILGKDAKASKDYPKAIDYYKLALRLKPNDDEINAELGGLYFLQNDLDSALSYYQNASLTNPKNKIHIQRLAEIEVAIGTQYFKKSSLYKLKKDLRNLIELTTLKAPYAAEITNALGANLKSYSAQNRRLQSLGKAALSAHQIEADCLEAFKLIRSAYDGKANHKKPEEMPEDLLFHLEMLESQLISLKSVLSEIFQSDQTIAQNDDTGDPLDLAVVYYEKARERLPNGYKSYYNCLIDAYIQQGNLDKALGLYLALKNDFPISKIQINPIVYQLTFRSLIKAKKYEDAFKLINSAIQDFPTRNALKKCKSDLYFLLGEEAEQNKDLTSALQLYTLATKCGVDVKPACHIGLAKIHLLAMNRKIKIPLNSSIDTSKTSPAISRSLPSFINPKDGLESDYTSHFQAAAANLKKAADLNPYDAEIRFQLTRIIYHSPENVNFDVIPYMQKAVELEPKNIAYAYALLMMTMRTYNLQSQDPEAEKLLANLEDIGGSIATSDDFSYWTMSNPYHFILD